MADIMASPPAYHPTWWFELMGNKNTWKWQSPTTSQYRREKEGKTTFSGLVDKCISWLEDSDLDKPFLQPPAEAVAQSPPTQAPVDSAQPVTRGSPRDSSPMADIVSLQEDINANATIEDQKLDKLLGRCCRSLRARLYSGDFTTQQISAILEPLDRTVIDSRLSDLQIRILTRFIASTVISTVAALRRHNPGKAYDDAWAAIIDKVFSMEPSNSKFRLFRYMMEAASPADIDSIEDPLFAQMIQQFVGSHGHGYKYGVESTWTIRTALFAHAVDRLPEARFGAILQDIQSNVWDEAEARKHRLTWLLVRAHLSHSTTYAVAEMTLKFLDYHDFLLNLEVQKLAMARLASEGFLDRRSLCGIAKAHYEDPSSRWTVLAETSLEENGTDSLKSLLGWLQHTGEAPIFLRSLVIAQLAPESQDLGARARLVMEKMMSDTEFVHSPLTLQVDVIRKMMLKDRLNARVSKMRHKGLLLRHGLMDLMEHLAYLYMLAPRLSDRQALRGVEWCLRSYEKMAPDRRGSAKILVILSKVLIRDLQNGAWGRTERLQWLIAKIKQYHGNKRALKAAKTLEGWRKMIVDQQQRAG